MTPGRIAVLAALCALSAATSFAQEQRRTTPEPALRTTPEPAWQGVRVCNQAGENVRVAKALNGAAKDEYGRDQIVSEGWWPLADKACMILWSGPIRHRYYLIYAKSETTNGEWGGDVWICVSNQPFTITGGICPGGYNRRKFKEVDTGKEENQFTYNLRP
jgi:uncharacterized membrane protein